MTITSRRHALRLTLGLGSLALAACGGGGSSSADASGSGSGAGTGNGTDAGTGSGSGSVGAGAPSITTQPTGTTVRSGATATFTVVATSSTEVRYQWLRNGTAIDGATASAYVTDALSYADTGASYSVLVSNTSGSVSSDAAVLNVTPGIIEIETNFYASYALLEDGTMWGWGSDDSLGVGNTVITAGSAAKPRLSDGSIMGSITHLGGGEKAIFTLRADGSVWGWGSNGDGELGDGTKVQRKTPVRVVDAVGAGFGNVIAVASGTEHTLALRSDGTVWAWGGNTHGQLGNGVQGGDSVAQSLVPVQVLTSPATPLTGVTAIAAGSTTSLALLNDGTVWAWGHGTLGNGTAIDATSVFATRVEISSGVALTDVVAIAQGMSQFGMALRRDGTVWSWGNSHLSSNRLRPAQVMDAAGAAFGNVKAIATGYGFALLLRNDGSVWSIGVNANGALGIGLSTFTGTNSIRSHPVQVLTGASQALGGIVAVKAHGFHALTLASDGTLWTWGYNAYAQVGDGTTTSRTTAFQITGFDS